MKDYYIIQAKILWSNTDRDSWKYDSSTRIWEHKNKYNGYSISWIADYNDSTKFDLIATKDGNRVVESGKIEGRPGYIVILARLLEKLDE